MQYIIVCLCFNYFDKSICAEPLKRRRERCTFPSVIDCAGVHPADYIPVSHLPKHMTVSPSCELPPSTCNHWAANESKHASGCATNKRNKDITLKAADQPPQCRPDPFPHPRPARAPRSPEPSTNESLDRPDIHPLRRTTTATSQVTYRPRYTGLIVIAMSATAVCQRRRPRCSSNSSSSNSNMLPPGLRSRPHDRKLRSQEI